MKNETETEVKDSHLVSNASLSAESNSAMEGKAAKDAEWLKNVRFAIEGVTQLLVGMIGLVGKDIKYLLRLSFDIRIINVSIYAFINRYFSKILFISFSNHLCFTCIGGA